MRTQQIADVLGDAEYGRQDLQRLAGYRTLLAAPMMLGDEVVGALLLWRTAVAPFSDHEMRTAGRLRGPGGGRAAPGRADAVAGVAGRGAGQQGASSSRPSARSGEAVSSTLDPDEVLDRIVTNAVRLTGTDGGSIMEYDERADAFLVRAAYGSSAGAAGPAPPHHDPALHDPGRPCGHPAPSAPGRRRVRGVGRPAPRGAPAGRLAVGARRSRWSGAT